MRLTVHNPFVEGPPPASQPCSTRENAAPAKHRAAAPVLSSLLCAILLGCCQSNDPNCRNVSLGPSGAEVAGVAIATGAVVATVIAVEVHHKRHTLDGCVSGAPGSLQLTTHSGANAYALGGNTAALTTGRRFRLHGSKAKRPRHSTAEPEFLVEHATKDYGPCTTITASASAPATTP